MIYKSRYRASRVSHARVKLQATCGHGKRTLADLRIFPAYWTSYSRARLRRGVQDRVRWTHCTLRGYYFRAFAERVPSPAGAGTGRGYHKSIMLTGNLDTVRSQYVHKLKISPGVRVIVLGVGTASSQALGTGDAVLDLVSVQKENMEMRRQCSR